MATDDGGWQAGAAPWAALRRLPFPAQVLAVWLAVRAGGRIASVCFGFAYDDLYAGMARPWPASSALGLAARVGSLLIAGLMIHGVLSLLRRRPRGRGLFVAAWGLDALAPLVEQMGASLPAPYSAAVVPPALELVGRGFWLAVVWSYLSERPAAGEAVAAAGDPRPVAPPAPLPLAAKLLAIGLVVSGVLGVGSVAGIVYSVLAGSPPLGGGPLLVQVRVYGSWALGPVLGAVRLAAGIGLLRRREWGRWLLMAEALFGALGGVGGAAWRYASVLSVPGRFPLLEVHWAFVRRLAGSVGHAAFVIGYACSARVRAAMRRPGT